MKNTIHVKIDTAGCEHSKPLFVDAVCPSARDAGNCVAAHIESIIRHAQFKSVIEVWVEQVQTAKDDETEAIERMPDGPAASPEGAALQKMVQRAKAGK